MPVRPRRKSVGARCWSSGWDRSVLAALVRASLNSDRVARVLAQRLFRRCAENVPSFRPTEFTISSEAIESEQPLASATTRDDVHDVVEVEIEAKLRQAAALDLFEQPGPLLAQDQDV